MKRILATRLLSSLLVLWLVVTLTFVALHVAPGDPASTILDPRASQDQIELLREHYGFNDGLLSQYGTWISNCIRGDLGLSFLYQRSAANVIGSHLSATILLGGFATLLGTLSGLGLGLLAAVKRGRRTDLVIRLVGLVLYATPTFWLGLMLALLFAGGVWNWLPSAGMLSPLTAPGASPWHPAQWIDLLRHLLLPGSVLAAPLAVQISRHVRFGLEAQLELDYVTAGRSMGLSERRLLILALRNSIGPLVQVLGVWMPVLVSGAVVIEQVFSWPGLGAVAVNAISGRDYPLVLALTLLTATCVVLANLTADLVHACLDPRVRAAKEAQ